MRPSLRLLASAKPGKYLESFAPTGLTGIVTHPSPRPTLIYLYNTTLDKLKKVPESSVYRQSTEALTRQRLNIVESVKPPGFDSWLQRVQAAVAENPKAFEVAKRPDGTYAAVSRVEEENPEGELFEGRQFTRQTEGAYLNEEEMKARMQEIKQEAEEVLKPKLEWEQEPALEASQYVSLQCLCFFFYCLLSLSFRYPKDVLLILRQGIRAREQDWRRIN